MIKENDRSFPRELTKSEKYFLFSILPASKPGYADYRNKIEKRFVIGNGRFGSYNYIIGEEGSKLDLSGPSMPVFASGTVKIENDEIDVIVHEEFEKQIETDIAPKYSEILPEQFTKVSKWSYSEWNPGDPAPHDRSFVKEIVLVPGKFIFAVAPGHKKLWLHEFSSGINYLIPLSNYYNELMSVKGIRDPAIALKPNRLFEDMEVYSEQDFINAFIKYNSYMKRINFNFSKIVTNVSDKTKGIRFNVFKRGKIDK